MGPPPLLHRAGGNLEELPRGSPAGAEPLPADWEAFVRPLHASPERGPKAVLSGRQPLLRSAGVEDELKPVRKNPLKGQVNQSCRVSRSSGRSGGTKARVRSSISWEKRRTTS